MEYVYYIMNSIYKFLENFFNTFTIVSGKETLKVLYFSLLYLFISLISEITNLYSFSSVGSSLLAVIILILLNSISVIQRKDIENFKKLLKGDNDE